ncbi:hypothetical protein OIV83_005780 [Microbotryomycetes sp. JL201]|nr:hypothetical protein OIV83_005780 [Microbotryomycetes sp. JL201]
MNKISPEERLERARVHCRQGNYDLALVEASVAEEQSENKLVKSKSAQLRASVYERMYDDTGAEYEYMAASLLASEEQAKFLEGKSLECKDRKDRTASITARAMREAEQSIVPLNLEKLRENSKDGKLTFEDSEGIQEDRLYTMEVLVPASDKLQAVLAQLDDSMKVQDRKIEYKGPGAQSLAEAILTDHNAFALPPGKDANFRLLDKVLLLCDMEQTSIDLPVNVKPVVSMPQDLLKHIDEHDAAAPDKLSTLVATTIVQGMCELSTGSATKAELHFLWSIMLMELVQDRWQTQIKTDATTWRFFSMAFWRATRLLHLLSTYQMKRAQSIATDASKHFQPVIDLAAFVVESAADDSTSYSRGEHIAFKLMHMAQASIVIAECLEARLHTYSPDTHTRDVDGTFSYNPKLAGSIAKLYAAALEHAPTDSSVKVPAAYASTLMTLYHAGLTIEDLFARMQQAETFHRITRPIFGPVVASDPHRLELMAIAQCLRQWLVEQMSSFPEASLTRLLQTKIERLPVLDGHYKVESATGPDSGVKFTALSQADLQKGVKSVKFISKGALP